MATRLIELFISSYQQRLSQHLSSLSCIISPWDMKSTGLLTAFRNQVQEMDSGSCNSLVESGQQLADQELGGTGATSQLRWRQTLVGATSVKLAVISDDQY